MPVGKSAQSWLRSHFPWILSKGISLPIIRARSRWISPTFEPQTEPETLGTSQLLRICLTSRAEAALMALSLLLFSISNRLVQPRGPAARHFPGCGNPVSTYRLRDKAQVPALFRPKQHRASPQQVN